MKALLHSHVWLVLLATALLPRSVDARIVTFVSGHGEEIVHVRDLPADVRFELRKALGKDVAVGFLFRKFHVFYLTVWTWDGQHVLYRGAEYWMLNPEEWAGLLGADAGKLGVPLSYRLPLGLAILVGIIALCAVGCWYASRGRRRTRRLLRDPRYQEALRIYYAEPSASVPDAAPLSEDPAEASFARAARHLRDRGVAPAEAEEDLALILKNMTLQETESVREGA